MQPPHKCCIDVYVDMHAYIMPQILSCVKILSIKAEERMESIRTLKAAISSNFKQLKGEKSQETQQLAFY